jgi:hypothetical protein
MSSPRWSLVLVAALGCGHDADESSGPILYGQWGSIGDAPAQLLGLGVAAELQLLCSAVGTNTPVELGPDNTFEFSGRLRTSMLESREPTARVQGRLQGETVTLTVDILGDNLPSSRYTLERGVNPHFEDQPPSCPQAD